LTIKEGPFSGPSPYISSGKSVTWTFPSSPVPAA